MVFHARNQLRIRNIRMARQKFSFEVLLYDEWIEFGLLVIIWLFLTWKVFLNGEIIVTRITMLNLKTTLKLRMIFHSPKKNEIFIVET
ncbi:hypothetical protein RCL_jg24139.t1 [Rhizophagus clarus]|uniref:Uncharacterized protein n=1 Tax=Rhizophagus clarus TaxID=94130 RepID=A0A8H3LAP0_9GLOM|nr:hypothetical protein RCL_jg24139.t1 [Rhizophagus clarus]